MNNLPETTGRPVPAYSLFSIRNFYTIYRMTYADGFVFPGERHNFWELGYVLSGSCTITAEDNVFLCNAGDAMLHAPNCFHTLRVEENSSCKIITVSFDGPGLSQLYSGQYTLTDEEKYYFDQVIKELIQLFGEHGETEFTRFFKTVPPDNMGLQIIKSLLELICLSLAQRGEAALGLPQKDSTTQCYAKIMTFLRDNVEKNLTIQDICRNVYESPGKVKDIFRRFTGGGIMQHFNRLRCTRIMQLLSEGHSIKSIADTMEFSSPYYLSYFFKRETGMTAREYLKSKE